MDKKILYYTDSNLFENFNKYDLLFQIENNFVRTNDVNQSDIILILPKFKLGHLVFDHIDNFVKYNNIVNKNFFIFFTHHIDEWHTEHNFKDSIDIIQNNICHQNNFYIIHKNIKLQDSFDFNLIYYDIMFNRQKAYYTQYSNFILANKIWSYDSTKKMYELDKIEKIKNKKFLILNKIYEDTALRTIYRKKLYQLNIPSSFYGDPFNNCSIPNQENTELFQFGPAHNYYYNNSLISVYIESIVGQNINDNSVGCVTEKSFDPLIKGNFILPFGYAGLICDIKNYGFLLPNWIDYSYDNEQNIKVRFNKFTQSLNDIINTNIDELYNKCLNDIHLLLHNRNVFFINNYDQLYNKIKKIGVLNV